MTTKTETGQFAVKQAGILVRKRFGTRAKAEAWAKLNYRGTDWEVIQISDDQ